MTMDFSFFFLLILIFVVAALYSSVGHGGASGYLAVLSFFAYSPAQMSSTALVLNVLVAGVSLSSYLRAKHLSLKLAWPFVIFSIPAAFIGGTLRVSEKSYFLLLALVLLFAAARLALPASPQNAERSTARPRFGVAASAGGCIGLLSGVVGVGGGIFLSPLMLLLRWASVKQTAAVSALFIVVNSVSGLAGRVIAGGLEVKFTFPLVAAAFLGGLLGSYLGATKFSGITLRRLLAGVLVIAAVKMIVAV